MTARKPPSVDWLRVVMYFLCGALLGGLVGLYFWFHPRHPILNSRTGLLVTLCCALAGVLA